MSFSLPTHQNSSSSLSLKNLKGLLFRFWMRCYYRGRWDLMLKKVFHRNVFFFFINTVFKLYFFASLLLYSTDNGNPNNHQGGKTIWGACITRANDRKPAVNMLITEEDCSRFLGRLAFLVWRTFCLERRGCVIHAFRFRVGLGLLVYKDIKKLWEWIC